MQSSCSPDPSNSKSSLLDMEGNFLFPLLRWFQAIWIYQASVDWVRWSCSISLAFYWLSLPQNSMISVPFEIHSLVQYGLCVIWKHDKLCKLSIWNIFEICFLPQLTGKECVIIPQIQMLHIAMKWCCLNSSPYLYSCLILYHQFNPPLTYKQWIPCSHGVQQ